MIIIIITSEADLQGGSGLAIVSLTVIGHSSSLHMKLRPWSSLGCILYLRSRDPPESMSHISDPPIFSRPSTKIPDKSPLYKFYLNCSRRFLSGVLSVLVFVHSPFCHNTSVSLQQKVKHHLKF